ncbi:hypothetical protein ENSA5_60390 [Enhygromyxa salina]|uniref:Uncharacterized protein n=1 Tax=Enhygromyxa salina TaxID=215803 RepID=A0A2S9XDM3_9BACT|nr:hypothetical protein [Enhygromyxa salina]PRP90964.1 hypothetical protein ENSA5_60390 [Enhygromyxa salina]
MSRAPVWLVTALVLVTLFARQAHAHELETNTARVSLRDGNLTIDLRADAGSLPDPDALLAGTRLKLDGAEVALELRSFPSREQLVNAAAAVAIETDLGGHAHARLLPVEYESASAGWSGQTLEIHFPAELGPVLVTFVQPKTQQLQAGATARFEVLTKAPEASPDTRAVALGWLLPLPLLALGVGIAWLHRRRVAHQAAG